MLKLDLPDADIELHRHFFTTEECDAWFDALISGVWWKQEQIKMYGRVLPLPRLTAWFGDQDTSYKYSGIRVHPEPWTGPLLAIKDRIQSAGDRYNSVLLNQYRNGRDSVAWHSDDEPELGPGPVIASVSLGEKRRFQLRHKTRKELRCQIELTHGSCLIMRGETQHAWQHQVPKETRSCGPRINLTYRLIRKY